MGELRAYAALAAAQARSVVSYRTSFLIELLTNVGATVFDVLTVLVLFRATDRIAGFTLPEALLITGIISAGFALADFTIGNVDRLKTYVRAGTLDAVLVRPLAALPQLLLMDLPIRKLLRVVFGFTVLVVAVRMNEIDWTPARVALLLVAPLSCAVFMSAIFVISASLAFWWVDSGELGSAFTYGGRDFASYPITVYGPVFRTLFAYVLGLAFIGYQPALALLGRPDPLGLPAWAGFASPLVALAAAVVAAAVWRVGLRHYRSTGS
ncbi:ABC-2 type transport system permease protein [Actinoplanes octamycinicus]|uniref:ABC-2 type transport system permease protein n=1 Tax=Actinoplanes octamycinicus TaxID=135948 RepID=A0A7W7GWQ2_9ACTN|nr:ABC-2 family transporter protein [Actinoplanes octamycinicus]MBB4739694.1 ABC-2 type transport system permease protein [Actinoplanes octamycinicus]GIE54878.1 transporter [Actinoplanes octamycinicus]